jgi:hypothetical protein
MLTHLRNFNVTFLIFHIINLQLYIRFYKVDKNEGALGKRLHEAIIVQPTKGYFMQGAVHLFIGDRTTSYAITNMPTRFVHMIYKMMRGLYRLLSISSCVQNHKHLLPALFAFVSIWYCDEA